MRALVQRVAQAEVKIANCSVGGIEAGLLVFVCAEQGDTKVMVDQMLGKILRLRIFADENGRMNRSVQDVDGGILIVSQFTLAADTRKGNRPSFMAAADPKTGLDLYNYFIAQAKQGHAKVACGRFGADMQIHLINDGPVTIPLHI